MRGSVFQAYIDQLQRTTEEKKHIINTVIFTHTQMKEWNEEGVKKKQQHRNKYELCSILWIIWTYAKPIKYAKDENHVRNIVLKPIKSVWDWEFSLLSTWTNDKWQVYERKWELIYEMRLCVYACVCTVFTFAIRPFFRERAHFYHFSPMYIVNKAECRNGPCGIR